MPTVAVQTHIAGDYEGLHALLSKLKLCLFEITEKCDEKYAEEEKPINIHVDLRRSLKLAEDALSLISLSDEPKRSNVHISTASLSHYTSSHVIPSFNGHLDSDEDSDSITSSNSSSEGDYSEDLDLLPALSPTEPKLLQYQRESEDVCLPNLLPSPSSHDGRNYCEFCGTKLCNNQSRSDSDSLSSSEETPVEVTEYCCRDRKKFNHLVSKYSKKLSTHTTQVGKIDISPGKKALKTVAKERALARLKAKQLQKQRELKLLGIGGSKVLQSSSFYSLARQTKTINFSLSEANNVQETWILENDKLGNGLPDGPRVGGSDVVPVRHVRRNRRKNKMAEEEDELIVWLRQQEVLQPSLLALKILPYSDSSIFRICHRDGTGQCYYPSGNVALVVTPISPGVQSYMVLTDSGPPQQSLLAYFDDLGRGFCYFEKSLEIRLSYGASGGCVLNDKGLARKKWVWNDESAFVQPMALNINSHILLRIVSQGSILLTMTVQPQFVAKFQVGRKLNPPMISSCDFKQIEQLEEYLQSVKTQISGVVEKLQGSVRRNLASKFSPERQTGKIFPPLQQKTQPAGTSSGRKKKVMF